MVENDAISYPRTHNRWLCVSECVLQYNELNEQAPNVESRKCNQE